MSTPEAQNDHEFGSDTTVPFGQLKSQPVVTRVSKDKTVVDFSSQILPDESLSQQLSDIADQVTDTGKDAA